MVPGVEGSNPFYRPFYEDFLTYLQAIILGFVQGITEFFPVSSSGHLELFQIFFGIQNIKDYIFFDLICHLGTLLAIGVAFHQEIFRALFKEQKLLLTILIALLPLFPLLLILKEIKSLFDAPFLLGFTFFITSLLLFLSSRITFKKPKERIIRDPLFIGLFQAFAILPGVSRSGSTIAAARFLGWGVDEAIRFSFLLAIPTILGGVFVESLSLMKAGAINDSVNMLHYALGFMFSFGVGLFSLKTLIWFGAKAIPFFAWYCLCLSLFCLVYFYP